MYWARGLSWCFGAIALQACSVETTVEQAASKTPCRDVSHATRTISCIERFDPGEGAGFGQESYPEIIFGAPSGGGELRGGTDVLSLGDQGEIVVGFGTNAIVDEDGADFVVFENAFWVGGDQGAPYAELGEISVSEDGEAWATFPCATDLPFDGCAGKSPVYSSESSGISPFDEDAGGDAFDLAFVGLSRAAYVRIRDVRGIGPAPTSGFDLDAVAILHAEIP